MQKQAQGKNKVVKGSNVYEDRIVQHQLKNHKQTDWELERFCDSHIYKSRGQAEKYGFK